MGVIIFTKDDTRYRKGNFIDMGREMKCSPTAPDITYIYHTNRFTEKDIKFWNPLIGYRLVIVGKVPKGNKETLESILIDETHSKSKDDFNRPIMGIFKWSNRSRVLAFIRKVPLPLIGAFLRRNRAKDIGLGRLLARSRYQLPDDYLYASIAYGTSPGGKVEWPKKKDKVYELPSDFRSSDKYAEYIVRGSVDVANDIRRSEPTALPDKMKKREEASVKWI